MVGRGSAPEPSPSKRRCKGTNIIRTDQMPARLLTFPHRFAANTYRITIKSTWTACRPLTPIWMMTSVALCIFSRATSIKGRAENHGAPGADGRPRPPGPTTKQPEGAAGFGQTDTTYDRRSSSASHSNAIKTKKKRAMITSPPSTSGKLCINPLRLRPNRPKWIPTTRCRQS